MPKFPAGPPIVWGAVPVVPLVLGFGFGVFVADVVGYTSPLYWLLAAGGCGIVAAGLVLRPSSVRWRAVLTSALILLAVFFLAGWRTNTRYLPAQDDFFAAVMSEGELLAGKITKVRTATTRMRAEITVSHVLRDSAGWFPVVGKLLVYLPPDNYTAVLETGDGIVLRGQPRRLRPPLNPYVFDLSAYWSRQNVYHQVFLSDAADWRRVPRSGGSLRARAEGWRRVWFNTFQRHLSGDQLAVAAALVMGQRDLLSAEVKSAYTDTGAVHVLAVSGLHVGIIFLLLNFLLNRLLRLNRTTAGRWLGTLVCISGIWAFALVSGLSTSVLRSALMFSILALGNLQARKTDIFNVLGAAALIILWLDPGQLFQVGFQLSFTAIIGIVLFTNYLEQLWVVPTRVLRAAWSAMAASTGAQLGTLPLSLFHFGQFPTWFLLSGTVVILSAFAIMFSGLLHGAVAGLAPGTFLASVTGDLLGGLVELQNAFVFFFRDLPGGLLRVPVFPWYQAVLLAAGIGLLAAWFRWRKAWVGVLGVLLFAGSLFWARTLVQGEKQGAGLVVYHRSRSSLIDVHGNGPAFAFGEKPAARDLAWSAGPYRERKGYEPTLTIPFSAPDTTLGPNLGWQPPYLQTDDHRLLILNGENPRPDADLSGVTIILVTNNFKPDDFPKLPSQSPPLVLLDGSNPPYRFADWRALAEQRGFELWITGEDGAWLE